MIPSVNISTETADKLKMKIRRDRKHFRTEDGGTKLQIFA